MSLLKILLVFFIILFFTLVKTISIVHNLKITIFTVCQYLRKIYQLLLLLLKVKW